jgi:SAM-dependent methyltransferase
VAVAGLVPGSRLLEVGCATGKATLPLARHGFRITCVEPGPHLAAAARRNVASLDVEIVEARFEDWRPRAGERFALRVRRQRLELGRPGGPLPEGLVGAGAGGHLAFWNAEHVRPDGGDPFFGEIQDIYDEIGEGVPPGTPWLRPGELEERRGEIEAGGLFEIVHVQHFDMERVYDADGYIELLNTFSGHIAMEAWQRDRLYGEIRRRLGHRADGTLRRHWGAVLHVARRLDS